MTIFEQRHYSGRISFSTTEVLVCSRHSLYKFKMALFEEFVQTGNNIPLFDRPYKMLSQTQQSLSPFHRHIHIPHFGWSFISTTGLVLFFPPSIVIIYERRFNHLTPVTYYFSQDGVVEE